METSRSHTLQINFCQTQILIQSKVFLYVLKHLKGLFKVNVIGLMVHTGEYKWRLQLQINENMDIGCNHCQSAQVCCLWWTKIKYRINMFTCTVFWFLIHVLVFIIQDTIYSKWDIKKPGDLYHCVLHMIHLIQILIICHALLFLYRLSFLNSWRWTYFGFWLSELVCCISYSVGFGFSICPVHNGVFKCHSIQSTPACIFRFSENLDKSSRFQKQAYDVNTITVIL